MADIKELELLIAGTLYRFIGPTWSPEKIGMIRGHPGFEEPEWASWEIMKENDCPEDTWRTLLPEEWRELESKHWKDVFEKIMESEEG